MLRPATILAVLLAALPARAEPPRLVTAGSAVTEIAAALGLAPQIVAVDTSGKEIEGMGDKPDVGYVRMLGAEGILSQKPDLVLVSGEAGPPPVLEQIRAAGVEVVVVPNGNSLDSIDDKIRAVAAATARILSSMLSREFPLGTTTTSTPAARICSSTGGGPASPETSTRSGFCERMPSAPSMRT